LSNTDTAAQQDLAAQAAGFSTSSTWPAILAVLRIVLPAIISWAVASHWVTLAQITSLKAALPALIPPLTVIGSALMGIYAVWRHKQQLKIAKAAPAVAPAAGK
jgi:hypothetical protein